MAAPDVGGFGIRIVDADDDEGPITVNITETVAWDEETDTLVTNKSITLPIKRQGLSHAQLIEILKILEKFWGEE